MIYIETERVEAVSFKRRAILFRSVFQLCLFSLLASVRLSRVYVCDSSRLLGKRDFHGVRLHEEKFEKRSSVAKRDTRVSNQLGVEGVNVLEKSRKQIYLTVNEVVKDLGESLCVPLLYTCIFPLKIAEISILV